MKENLYFRSQLKHADFIRKKILKHFIFSDNGDNMSFAGNVIRKIGKGIALTNLFEYARR